MSEPRKDGDSIDPVQDYHDLSRHFVARSLDRAATFIREKVVEPCRPKERPVYYHRKFARVPTVDECETDDAVCMYEANEQFLRDKRVDTIKLRILRRRLTECNLYWNESKLQKCEKERRDFEDSQINWFVKYGEVRAQAPLQEYLMKQKHRMAWVRQRQLDGDVNASYVD